MSIDLSLANIWRSWYEFRKNKKSSPELEKFQYYLENNLIKLYQDLNNGCYRHGGYSKFIIHDNKRREISVASIRDRVIHRLMYEYLVQIYDKSFIFDVWSSRKNKGLLGAIERTQGFLRHNSNSFVWRADIEKFFDNVDHGILLEILNFKIKDQKAILLLEEVIQSYFRVFGTGIPMGNLTSQIFANIYLNELDRFVKYEIKPKKYLRYGDDFILIDEDYKKLSAMRKQIVDFIRNKLKLNINYKNNIIIKVRWGLRFLGTIILPNRRRLTKRNSKRMNNRLNIRNVSSYWGLVNQHQKDKLEEFNWRILEKIDL